jgi:hypothetical protein
MASIVGVLRALCHDLRGHRPAPASAARSAHQPKEPTMTSNLETLVDRHLAAYGEPDATLRSKSIASIWHAEGRLVDPPIASAGHQGIGDLAATLLSQFPGHTFVRTTAVDAHHEFARYGWALRNHEGVEVLRGTDFVTLDVDGRIQQIVGFFGEPSGLD